MYNCLHVDDAVVVAFIALHWQTVAVCVCCIPMMSVATTWLVVKTNFGPIQKIKDKKIKRGEALEETIGVFGGGRDGRRHGMLAFND